MQHRPRGAARHHVTLAFVCAACAPLFVAGAESAAYTVQLGQETRAASVDVVPVEGQPSVSIKALVAAFGGQVKVSGNTVQVTLASAAVTLTIGDTEVAAAQKFTLQHAPRVYENDVYIAASDVAPLFSYGFKLEVRSGAPAPQSATPAVPSGRKLRVVIDAGHGGADAGATGQSGTPEKAIARAIAGRVAKLIEAACQPAFTRAEDSSPSVADRVSMANVALKGDILVSIHTGASASPAASGFEFFCPMGSGDPVSSRSLALARSISNGMAQSTGATPRGLHQAPCRLFTNLQIPGVLIEVGFVTNPKEEPLLVNAEYQEKLAQGIANGIAAYAGGKAP